MRYERPIIVARERIAALLDSTTPSDKQNDASTPSDVHIKEHIHPVVWDQPTETVDYAKPEIVAREGLAALLTVSAPSDKQNDGAAASDVHTKAHIHPVVWGQPVETVDYTKPEIVGREGITALLGTTVPSDPQQKPDTVFSDVHRKEHIHPVVWGSPAETVPYAKPTIDTREALAAMLIDTSKSDPRDNN